MKLTEKLDEFIRESCNIADEEIDAELDTRSVSSSDSMEVMKREAFIAGADWACECVFSLLKSSNVNPEI